MKFYEQEYIRVKKYPCPLANNEYPDIVCKDGQVRYPNEDFCELNCSVCDGRGYILGIDKKELLDFLSTLFNITKW